ncbi:DUF6631 family protein [Thauera butanivorans]|uniref:DUF6631 family protein n=1 Tax=Thauera butanivorans TaxID=86174 RepID=UPI003AB529B5
MARKIGNTRHPQPTAEAQRAADELDILHPERTLTFAWGKIVVREYGGVEWMRLRAVARPIIDSLAALLAAGVPVVYEAALDVLADNMDAVLTLVAAATDESVETIQGLAPDELDDLLLYWWGANGRFFLHRAANAVAVMQVAAQIAQSAGASSTPPSFSTVTASPTSAATPAGN